MSKQTKTNTEAAADQSAAASLTTKLTAAEVAAYELRASELATELNHSKVHPVAFIHPTTLERSVCYLAEPNFSTKLAIMDKSLTVGIYQAGEELMRLSLIKEASDPCMYSEHPSSDDYRMGIIDFCLTMISRFQNQLKKK
jgi:hypothetical protein